MTGSVVVPAQQDGGGASALEFVGIEKRFGQTLALKDVSVVVRSGAVHAFVGENGAGKSTLLGVATGRIAPTNGDVRVFGTRLRPNRPRLARELGVAVIYQEPMIVPALSVAENVFLGARQARLGFVTERDEKRLLDMLSSRVGLDVPPEVPAGSLSVSQQQLVEIMRALAVNARVFLFDEPTSSLAERERESFFQVVADLKRQGCAIVLVSHNLDEVAAHTDEVSVFRDGRHVAQQPTGDWTKASLVTAMIGAAKAEKAESLRRAFFDEPPPTDTEASTGLSKADVIMRAEVDLPGRVESVSLTVKKGEILGIAGLVGSGRTSLLRALAGLEPQARGSLTIGSVTGKLPRSPRAALRRGVALIPEDRMTQGLALNMRAAENMLLGDLGQVASYGMISERKLLQRAVELAAEVGFAPARVKETARWLSGGNQQKLLVGRWRHAPPSVLLADEPTRGVDIGAKAEILSTLTDFAAEGRGVILVSSELEEVLAVSHRVLVLRDGEVVTSIERGPALTVHAVLDAVFRVDAGQVAAD